jgi:DNA-binding transcriptional LysR family regulator
VLSDYFINLIDQNIDVAFRIGVLSDSALRAQRVATARRKLYATKKYLKRFGEPKSLADLHQHRLLFYTRLSEVPAWPLTNTGNREGTFPFRPYLECDGSELIREAMLSDVGIALLPTWMIGPNELGQLRPLLERHDPVPSPVFALTSDRGSLSTRQRATIEFFKERLSRNSALSLREK